LGLFSSIGKAVKKVAKSVGNVVSKVVNPVAKVVKNVVNSPVGNIVANIIPGGKTVQGAVTKVVGAVSSIVGGSTQKKSTPKPVAAAAVTSVPTGGTVVSAPAKTASVWDDIYDAADKVGDFADKIKGGLTTGDTVEVPPLVDRYTDDDLKVFNQQIFVERRV
jgi:phage-related protein